MSGESFKKERDDGEDGLKISMPDSARSEAEMTGNREVDHWHVSVMAGCRGWGSLAS